jgi:GntR family transcriptional regulator of arabinose operon
MTANRKFMEIVEWAAKQIGTGAFLPGDKFLSESELGARFACSRQTVRRALEVLERRGRVKRVQGSGTYVSAVPSDSEPAFGAAGHGAAGHGAAGYGAASADSGYNARAGGPAMTVGIISTFLDNFVFPGIIRGIEDALLPEGFALQLTSTRNSVAGETRALQLMLARRLDGLIVEPTRSALPCANLDLYRVCADRGLPMVFIDSFYPELSAPYVAMDDVRAGYLAARHLLDAGHRRVLGIFPHSNRQGHLRYLGYVKALAEQGLGVQDDRILWYSKENMAKLTEGDHFWDFLSGGSAVVCYNDRMALSVVELLRERGRRVPDDLSVTSIDDSILARTLSLTSVAHPSDEIGSAAARLLLAMIKGAPGANVIFPPKLVVRASVRNPEEFRAVQAQ